jgi:hypothetical protein
MGTQLGTLLIVLLLHFCSPIVALNALAPRNGIIVEEGIAYAEGQRHELDVYAPNQGATSAPVVVFFYGGGWETGDRAMYRFLGASLAARGVVVVIPDYRLHPAVRFPAFMDDGAAAVAWAHMNAARFGGDPTVPDGALGRRADRHAAGIGSRISACGGLDAGARRVRRDRPGRTV